MNTTETARIFCLSTYEKGQAFLEECAALGGRVVLLTVDKHRNGDWPRAILEDFVTMPDGLTLEQVTNTVTYLARTKRFDRIVGFGEFDMGTEAALRRHMRIEGMGVLECCFVREFFGPGDFFHADSIVSEGAVVFTSVSGYGKPPMQTMHE